jgi:hypothetical protein
VRGKTVAQHGRACFPFPADFSEQVVNVVSQCADVIGLSVLA